jgi:hypothetical protein
MDGWTDIEGRMDGQTQPDRNTDSIKTDTEFGEPNKMDKKIGTTNIEGQHRQIGTTDFPPTPVHTYLRAQYPNMGLTGVDDV